MRQWILTGSFFVALPTLFLLFASWLPTTHKETRDDIDPSIALDNALEEVGRGPARSYKCGHFIKVVLAGSKAGEDVSIASLRRFVKSGASDVDVVALCRLLYTGKDAKKLRRAAIGGTSFPGGTEYRDWPLEPIEIVEGVPFLISESYLCMGVSETALEYLAYCRQEGIWAPRLSVEKSTAELERALATILHSKKWKTDLYEDETRFLKEQVRTPINGLTALGAGLPTSTLARPKVSLYLQSPE